MTSVVDGIWIPSPPVAVAGGWVGAAVAAELLLPGRVLTAGLTTSVADGIWTPSPPVIVAGGRWELLSLLMCLRFYKQICEPDFAILSPNTSPHGTTHGH